MGTDPIRIFVGSSSRDLPAEMVLEHSIRKNTEAKVEFTWMRAGDPGFDDWNCLFDLDPKTTQRRWQGPAFSMFRFAVPELAGFDGHAIYLDSDMLVRGDIKELWNWLQKGPILCCAPKRLCVSKWDCGRFRVPWWPSIEEMKSWKGVTASKGPMKELLTQHDYYYEHLTPHWNIVDGKGFMPGATRLVHYSNTSTQPWTPWPEKRKYRTHPNAEMKALWFDTYREATASALDAGRRPMLLQSPSSSASNAGKSGRLS